MKVTCYQDAIEVNTHCRWFWWKHYRRCLIFVAKEVICKLMKHIYLALNMFNSRNNVAQHHFRVWTLIYWKLSKFKKFMLSQIIKKQHLKFQYWTSHFCFHFLRGNWVAKLATSSIKMGHQWRVKQSQLGAQALRWRHVSMNYKEMYWRF